MNSRNFSGLFVLTVVFLVQTDAAVERCSNDWVWSEASGTCFKLFQQHKSWQSAAYDCQEHGGHLVNIGSPDLDAQIRAQIDLGTTRRFFYWIGLNDRTTEGSFVWVDTNKKANYTNWSTLEPNNLGGEDCVVTDGLGWNDFSCVYKLRYICERGHRELTTEASHGTCDSNWVWSRGSNTCIRLFDFTLDWSSAREFCQLDSGGDLVNIRDKSMDTLINDQITNKGKVQYWISLNDRRREGLFTWGDILKKPEYTSWKQGEPNDVGRNEDCVITNGLGWNDLPCSRPFRFICEKPAQKGYGVPENMAWMKPTNETRHSDSSNDDEMKDENDDDEAMNTDHQVEATTQRGAETDLEDEGNSLLLGAVAGCSIEHTNSNPVKDATYNFIYGTVQFSIALVLGIVLAVIIGTLIFIFAALYGYRMGRERYLHNEGNAQPPPYSKRVSVVGSCPEQEGENEANQKILYM